MKLTDFDPTDDRVHEYRGFILVHTDPYGFVHIERQGPGVLPKALDNQVFTDRSLAQKVIDTYLSNKEETERKREIPLDDNTRKTKEMMKEIAEHNAKIDAEEKKKILRENKSLGGDEVVNTVRYSGKL